MWQTYLNYHQRMGILPLKMRVNRNKCSFTTKLRMFVVFAVNEILCYRWAPLAGSRTLCHSASKKIVRAQLTFWGGNCDSRGALDPACGECFSRVQGGITCGAIEDPRKSSKAIDERVIINFRDKNGVIARFRDKNVVIVRFCDKNVECLYIYYGVIEE